MRAGSYMGWGMRCVCALGLIWDRCEVCVCAGSHRIGVRCVRSGSHMGWGVCVR